jgi:hypothetical protein
MTLHAQLFGLASGPKKVVPLDRILHLLLWC